MTAANAATRLTVGFARTTNEASGGEIESDADWRVHWSGTTVVVAARRGRAQACSPRCARAGGPIARSAWLSLRLAGSHLRARCHWRSHSHRSRNAAHRVRHRGCTNLPASPLRHGPAGADSANSLGRSVYARNRFVARLGHRGHAWTLL